MELKDKKTKVIEKNGVQLILNGIESSNISLNMLI